MLDLDLESEGLQSTYNLALSIQIAAAGVATSFVLILIPNFETISLTAFILGFGFRKKFAFITTIVMIFTWELLATLVFSTSGVIFLFKIIAWISIMLLGILARILRTTKIEYFILYGLLSALIFDLLVTIPFAIINTTNIDNFMTVFFSSLLVGIYFSFFHIIGNSFLFSLVPSIYDNMRVLLERNFSSVIYLNYSFSLNRKKVFAYFILLILVFSFYNIISSKPSSPQDKAEYISVRLDISYSGIISNESYMIDTFNNNSAFEILNNTSDVTYSYYGIAVFVEGINGVYQNQNITGYYWIYYVDGVRSDIGSSDYIISSNSVILWNYESG